MAKIIVDINEDNKYHFIVKKDSNFPVAYSEILENKTHCMDLISLFRSFAKDGVYWHFETDAEGFYYATWKSAERIITTRKYKYHRDLFAIVNYIKEYINFGTPIFHTVVRNSKFHNNA